MGKNFLSIFIYLLGIIGVITGGPDVLKAEMTLTDMIEMLKTVGASCNPTDEIAREIVLNEENVERETKCFRYCLMKLLGLHSPNTAQIAEEKVVEYATLMYPKNIKEFTDAVKACNAKNVDIVDNCDVAHEQTMCMIKTLQEKGVELPMFEDEE